MKVAEWATFTQRGGSDGFVYKSFASGSGSINFDFTTGVLPGAITFTRASIGTYNSSGNILTTAGNDVARFNYVAGVACLLIEPAATNLLLDSDNFGSANWAPSNASVISPNQFVSPDGTNDGWSATSGTGNGGAGQFLLFSNIPYTMSLWAKQVTGTPPAGFQLNTSDSGPLATGTTLTRLSATLTPSSS